jgi:hypothetical protein
VAEFTAPGNEAIPEEPPGFDVLDEGRDGFVRALPVPQCSVLIPELTPGAQIDPGMVDLDYSHASFGSRRSSSAPVAASRRRPDGYPSDVWRGVDSEFDCFLGGTGLVSGRGVCRF